MASPGKMTPKELAAFIELMRHYGLGNTYKDQLEQRWKYLVDSQRVKTQEYVVWIDESLNESPKEISGEPTTMIGTDYIQYSGGNDPRARYKHMRGMLQEIWNIQHKHPSNRFDIDGNFGYDDNKIAHYIQSNASPEEINAAHRIVIDYYRNKGRGRPKGARNIDKVVRNNDPIDLDDMTNDQIIEELKPETPKPNGVDGGQHNFSSDELERVLRDYVTHNQLTNERFVREQDLINVARNLEKALKESLIIFEEETKKNKPTIIELKRPDELPNIEMGIQHRCLKQLLLTVQATLRSGNRVIPWVYGPAGTGKSVAAENVAKALGISYHVMGTTLAKFEILGFINTTGYQSTPFREAYEHGGVFCADEMDSWAKEATVALNNGLANGHCTFPDKTIARHPNFVMIACANTTGAGATLEFVGRNKQDGATLNRFVHIYWPLDEALEDHMCANKDWLKYVRHVRQRVATSNLNPKPLITPRASIFGETLLNSGLELPIVIDMCLRQGLSDVQWGQIK
jgi:hypothetical protein